MNLTPLSVVLITYNAEDTLSNTLKALQPLQAEIVIVDSGSTDSTHNIAQHYGARWIEEPWRGFGAQKHFAVEQASHDWVLCLDADEEISVKLSESILKTLKHPAYWAYRFARANRFLGHFLRHGEGYPDWSLRLFHRKHAQWSLDTVHEYVKTETPMGTLEGDLLHYSAESLSRYWEKQNQYTTLQAQMLFKRGKKASLAQLVLSPIVRFIRFYLIKQGFRDGAAGLIHISIGCINSFMKYAKLLELWKHESKK